MKRRWFYCLWILALAGCQFGGPTAPPATATALSTASPLPATLTPEPGPPKPIATITVPPEASPTPAAPAFDIQPFAQGEPAVYQPGKYMVTQDALPVDLAGLGNPAVIQNLSAEQKAFLSQNGFVVLRAGDGQFKDIRRSVADIQGQPYYLTTDAAYHALHVSFNDVLTALERESLRPQMISLVKGLYAQVGSYASQVEGGSAQGDLKLASAYLAVALKLFKPDETLDPQTEALIAPQIQQIQAGGGKADSLLIPGFKDDYGAYRPVGHYAGKPELEAYFRGMTWLGRVDFRFKDIENPALVPSRAPLFITLALREAQLDNQTASQTWGEVNSVLDYLLGPSDDPGPIEVNALMESVFQQGVSLKAIASDANWQAFLARVDELPAPAINSTFANTTTAQVSQRGWRLMGQRFTPDAFIFQSLIMDKVKQRKFPSGLDVMAVFGSPVALDTLTASGETKYPNYPEQMAMLKGLVQQTTQTQWLVRFYTGWLFSFIPQIAPKDEAYPPYMRTAAWNYKEMNSALGSWAELKHDTVLYAKMPEGLGGGGPPMSGPAPAYAEPNPEVFYRLAYLANTLEMGLTARYGFVLAGEPPSESSGDFPLAAQLSHLRGLAETLQKIGDIAARELRGQALTAEDYDAIQTCLELKECLDHGAYSRDTPQPDPIPVVAAVSGMDDTLLEAGVGDLGRIYVAVPLEGKLEIAQGGVFSYYEFLQPRSDRLTDEAWRQKLASNPPAALAWSAQFTLPGGKPANALAFRIGDVYVLTKEGYTPPLNLRSGPSKTDSVVQKLDTEQYLIIVDGPVSNQDGVWWKVQVEMANNPVGWVLENQAWYQRSTPYTQIEGQ